MNYSVLKNIKILISSFMDDNKIKNYKKIKNLFSRKKGFEIGAPSMIFSKKGFIPIYNICENLDGGNFSTSTIWEGNINDKKGYLYPNNKNKIGHQYILDATNLDPIQDDSLDFVISSNCLKHIVNPLLAISEWLRILKSGRTLLIIVPDKNKCFDYKRSVTKMEHLINDLNNEVCEDDLTHLEEILELHDLTMDLPVGNKDDLKKRSLKNYENRGLHHHVFDIKLLRNIFNFFNIKELYAPSYCEHLILG